jgi:hypothetical protein
MNDPITIPIMINVLIIILYHTLLDVCGHIFFGLRSYFRNPKFLQSERTFDSRCSRQNGPLCYGAKHDAVEDTDIYQGDLI